MMRRVGVLLVTAVLAGCGGQEPLPPVAPAPPPPPGAQTIVRNGITLEVNNRDTQLPATTLAEMIDTFFAVYPVMSARFNANSRKTVSLVIDPNQSGVAFVSNGVINVAGTWMRTRPNDLDVMTHEAFHIVQHYPAGHPSWIVEGLADYARDRYGLHNARGGWSLPSLAPNHRYTDSYRVTARFFKWLEARVQPGILETLDNALRRGTFDERFWVERTGSTLDELWARYAADPTL